MQRDDCVDLFNRIPERYHAQVNLVLRGQGLITVDTVIRFEPTYVVLRGRESGTSDENRAFFVPYEEIAYLRVERALKIGDLKKMFGETDYVDNEDALEKAAKAELELSEMDTPTESIDAETPPPKATPLTHQDPVQIARQNLLERIRATRANAAGASGKFGGKK
jgi:hypothetical protein